MSSSPNEQLAKGIFCIEGFWDDDFRALPTVRPILDIIEKHDNIPNIYCTAGTRQELSFLLKKFVSRKYINFPILYIASHGTKRSLLLTSETSISLEYIAKTLKDKCRNKVLVFANCSIFKSEDKLDMILQETGALAACGYRINVDWVPATAFELLILNEVQIIMNSKCQSMTSLEKKINDLSARFSELQFIFKKRD